MENVIQETDFNEIVSQYGKRLFNLAYRMVGNTQDAEDVVQDTLYQAYRNFDRFKAQSSVYTWIYRICTNECLKKRKKRSLKYAELLDENFVYTETARDIAWKNNPDNIVAVSEMTAYIRSECHHIVMQKLTEAQRIVYILKVIFEMSCSDISQILEIDENAVKARLNRARNSLLRHFESHCEWFKTGSESKCCQKKLGYALAQDIEILNRAEEEAKDFGWRPDTNKKEFIDYIYGRLPAMAFNTEKINYK